MFVKKGLIKKECSTSITTPVNIHNLPPSPLPPPSSFALYWKFGVQWTCNSIWNSWIVQLIVNTAAWRCSVTRHSSRSRAENNYRRLWRPLYGPCLFSEHSLIQPVEISYIFKWQSTTLALAYFSVSWSVWAIFSPSIERRETRPTS